MKDKRIKSALEIAMEKTASMPGMTRDELIQQKKREYGPRGIAIANKYLGGALRGRDLRAELLKYRGQEGEMVRTACLSALFQSISLEDMGKSLKAIDGIQTVEIKADLNEIRRELEAIFNELRQQREQRYDIVKDMEIEKLRELWISGSAVRPNLEESEGWRQEMESIDSEYESRTSKLRQSLSQLIGT